MTNEEMQKAIDFIVEQEAKSSAKIDVVAEKIDALADAQTRAEERWKRTEEGIRGLLAIAEVHDREISTMGHHIGSLSRDIATLGETTRATDARLNALINVVDRVISNGRNGKP